MKLFGFVLFFSLSTFAAVEPAPYVCTSDDGQIEISVYHTGKLLRSPLVAEFEDLKLKQLDSLAFITLAGFDGDHDNNRSMQLTILDGEGYKVPGLLIIQTYTERGTGYREQIVRMICKIN